jgi:hypothetical protein
MPIESPAPPPQAAAAVQQSFRALAERGFQSPVLRAADPARLALTEPHEVFVIEARDLAAGRGLDAAKSTRWRYLVAEGNQIIAAASAIAPGQTNANAFSHISEGPFVKSTAEAIALVRSLPNLSGANYTIRVLQIPALNMMALWLHPTAGDGDLLVVLPPSPVGVPTGQALPASQLIAELQGRARDVAGVGPDDTRGG